MPADIGNSERLFTEQLSDPGLGVYVLVQALFPFSGCGIFDNGG